MHSILRALAGMMLLLSGLAACGMPSVTPTQPVVPTPLPEPTATTAAVTPTFPPSPAPEGYMPPPAPGWGPTPTLPPTRIPVPTCRPFDLDAPDPDLPENYIGRSYRDPPPGWSILGGWCLGDCEYALERVASPDGQEILWLERFRCRLPDGRAQFEIRDVLVLPPIGGGKGLLEYCGRGPLTERPARDVEIIGYGRIECSGVNICTVELEHAWRANRTSESFEELPLEGITCWVDEGY